MNTNPTSYGQQAAAPQKCSVDPEPIAAVLEGTAKMLADALDGTSHLMSLLGVGEPEAPCAKDASGPTIPQNVFSLRASANELLRRLDRVTRALVG